MQAGRLAALLRVKPDARAEHKSNGPKSKRVRQQKTLETRKKKRVPRSHTGSSDGEEAGDEHDLPSAADAYAALVGQLSGRRGRLGAALKARAAQQQGDSDADDGGGGSSLSAASDEERAGSDSSGSGVSVDDAGGDSDSGSQESGGRRHRSNGAVPARVQQQQQRPAAAVQQAASLLEAPQQAEAAVQRSSNWDTHMSRQLGDAEAAALLSKRRSWQDAPAAGSTDMMCPWPCARWQIAGRDTLPSAPTSLADCGVRERLITRWREVQEADAERLASHAAASTSGDNGSAASASAAAAAAAAANPGGGFASVQQRVLFALYDSYMDVLHAAKPYPSSCAALQQPDTELDAALLHILNHCAKTGDAIRRNNERIKATSQGVGAADESSAEPEPPRDQGFTRPKALILLPMRNSAYRVVRRLTALAQRETRADSVQGKEKFIEQFAGSDDDDAGGNDGASGDGGKGRKGAPKPAEHSALFRGSLDDHFRLGIRITRGQVKLFADFLTADIIIASPIGLATKLAEDAAEAAAAAEAQARRRAGGKRGAGSGGSGSAATQAGAAALPDSGNADYLSSIEICVIERADVMLMQNWSHVVTVLEALNRLPREQHGVDIMRVRPHLLAGWGGLYRQTIITASFATPTLHAAFGRLARSHAGGARLVTSLPGVLGQVVPQARQLFERFSAPAASTVADARFAFFTGAVWPRLAEAGGSGLLLFVPNYFDFVRIRNFMAAQEADYAVLSEYCSRADVTRGRARFFQRRARLLLYTERAHFYNRFSLRGIRDVLFYGPPDHAHYYSELVNLLQPRGGGGAAAGAAAALHGTVTTLFCAYDALALGRIVGAGRCSKMLDPDSASSFVFC